MGSRSKKGSSGSSGSSGSHSSHGSHGSHGNCSCDKDCLCSLLSEFIHEDVTILTRSGDTITGELEKVTKDCCVKILVPGTTSPPTSATLVVIRCKDIERFSVPFLFG
ncbi:hypothetical protein ABES02_00005 [Neobacillus pocheonensis]|uniref:hypothetical protein n=1 Tax=Neobacillus pocheonensis TaxID=363869 RepID=UPI003D280317